MTDSEEKLAIQETSSVVPQPSTTQLITVNDATSMLQAVGVLAMDPNTDVEKIERLMAIQERLQAKENEQRFDQIMADVQEKIKTAIKNKHNAQTNSNYADLSAVLKSTKAAYTSAGMALSFNTEPTQDVSIVRLVCYVTAAGHSKCYTYDSPLTDKGIAGKTVMTTAHARGSAISYGRRYLTQMIFNLDTADDDDANACADIEWITEEQAADLGSLIEEVGADRHKFLKYMGAQSLDRIRSSAYGQAVSALEAKRKKA